MTFLNCLNDALDEGSIDAGRKAQAQQDWLDRVDLYERQGHPRHTAQAMAAQDVKEIYRKKAGDERHRLQAMLTNARKMQRRVDSVDSKNLRGVQTQTVELMDYQTRALTRYFNMRVSEFLSAVHRKSLGNLSDEATMLDITRELHGEQTGNAAAAAYAKGVRSALEEMRLMFNQHGGLIGKLDNWGLPHSHDRFKIIRAGKDKWVNDLIDNQRLDWTRIEDKLTGRPFQASPDDPPPSKAVQREILNDVWDNLSYGKGSRQAQYGKAQGQSLYRQRAEERVLHFRGADNWIAYNKDYGTGDPFNSLMSHVHGMAQDIASLQALGPNPGLGLDYQAQMVNARARKEGIDPDTVKADARHAERMLRMFNGPLAPEGKIGIMSARFFSNLRHLQTAAFLDKAIVASISDFNSVRLAAKAIGANPNAIMRSYGQAIKGMISEGTMSTQQLKRDRWVLDTLADPGVAMARFQMEVPPSEIFERLSSASMRLQGLTHHTDSARYAYQAGFWGRFADEAGKPLSEVTPEFRKILEDHGVTARDWDDFRAGGMYEPEPGVTFLNPLYWRESTDLPVDRADEVFLQMQSLVERWTEIAVPTNSLKAKAFIDPVAWGLPPGSVGYEFAKSAGMFKSFVAAFTINQYRMIARQPNAKSRALYAVDMVGGATVMGALSLQIGEIIKGNDPQDMTPFENPMFWARAVLKGGGFGILGDIVSTGEASWGGGFGSYLAGPMAQFADDAWDLTVSNATDAAGDIIRGEEIDTGFGSDVARAFDRYLPLGDNPVVGLAVDRLLVDSLQRLLDPQAEKAILDRAQRRENLYGNDSFWMPGSPTPDRLPNFGAAIGAE